MTYRMLAKRILEMTEDEMDQEVFVKHPEVGCLMEVGVAWANEDIVSEDEDALLVPENGIYLEMIG